MASPFVTENTEIRDRRHAVLGPDPAGRRRDRDDFEKEFKGTISFVKANEAGKMDIAFQLLVPGFNYDLGHAGQGPVPWLGVLHVV